MVVKARRVAQPVDSFPGARAGKDSWRNRAVDAIHQARRCSRALKSSQRQCVEMFASRATISSGHTYITNPPFVDYIALFIVALTVSLGRRDRTHGANSTAHVRRLVGLSFAHTTPCNDFIPSITLRPWKTLKLPAIYTQNLWPIFALGCRPNHRHPPHRLFQLVSLWLRAPTLGSNTYHWR